MSIYDNMNFPSYKYEEYPKMVRCTDGRDKIVHNKAEELAAMDEIVPVVEVDRVLKEKANVEKLLAEAQERMKELEAKLKASEMEPEKKGAAPIIASKVKA